MHLHTLFQTADVINRQATSSVAWKNISVCGIDVIKKCCITTANTWPLYTKLTSSGMSSTQVSN